MKNLKEGGGPAFPSEQGFTPEGTWNQTYAEGMSLRDWFAGQALPQAVEDYDRKTRGVMDTKLNVLPCPPKSTNCAR